MTGAACTNMTGQDQSERLVSANKSESPDRNFAAFTTEGKATKILETPEGDRDVYDPQQDRQVREAFKWVYDKNYQNTSLYNSDRARRELGDKNVDLIFLAKEI